MTIEEALKVAREIGTWIHGQTDNSEVRNERRTIMAASAMQHVLDIADAIVVLIGENLQGVALTLARPLHEGYTQSVWLLTCATEEQLDKYSKGICPKLQTLVKQIGDDPETGGAFIKGMTEKNISDFNNLTHGGMAHTSRRSSEVGIEQNYGEEEIFALLKARNQYCMLTAFFLLTIMEKKNSLLELEKKRSEWESALLMSRPCCKR
ncbi:MULTISPECIES: DUF6988 family protein [Marinobacter]|uniref:DUF6988 family protein n=1 Tax=Marinobacter TaxID=2742 RepID=UPI001247D1C8|nr:MULTISPECIES: hypothetical protein [Marinobacter]MBL3559141.1 hypothetical protein [Marinobacter sp. JB05H06]